MLVLGTWREGAGRGEGVVVWDRKKEERERKKIRLSRLGMDANSGKGSCQVLS